MKRFFAIICLLVAAISVTPVVEAKKFGGGKSFGKSYKTAPSSSNQATRTDSISKPGATTPAKSSFGKGMLGGMLGGILAGTLIGSLLSGSGFSGGGFMDIILMLAVAFILFKLFKMFMASKQGSLNQKSPHQPAFGGNSGAFDPSANKTNNAFDQTLAQKTDASYGSNKVPEQNAGFGGSAGFGAPADVPHRYQPEFDKVAFLNGAREHYRILQSAWNLNQLHKIQEYVVPSLFEELKKERANLSGEQHTDVMFVDADIVRADYSATQAELSLQFSGRYRDSVEGIEEDITDVWHLERDLTVPNAPWLIVGIQ